MESRRRRLGIGGNMVEVPGAEGKQGEMTADGGCGWPFGCCWLARAWFGGATADPWVALHVQLVALMVECAWR